MVQAVAQTACTGFYGIFILSNSNYSLNSKDQIFWIRQELQR